MDHEQDVQLPIANVGRIMKQILPSSAKISKEAKEIAQDCVSEFVKFVTCEASDRCRKENRKTVNGDDICWALRALGFDECAGATVRYLYKYREFEMERLNHKVQNEVDGAEAEAAAAAESEESDYKCIKAGKQTESIPVLLFKVSDQNDNDRKHQIRQASKGFAVQKYSRFKDMNIPEFS